METNRAIVPVSICIFKVKNCWMDFYEICYASYAIVDYPQIHPFQFTTVDNNMENL
jgi:hypothetical protein